MSHRDYQTERSAEHAHSVQIPDGPALVLLASAVVGRIEGLIEPRGSSAEETVQAASGWRGRRDSGVNDLFQQILYEHSDRERGTRESAASEAARGVVVNGRQPPSKGLSMMTLRKGAKYHLAGYEKPYLPVPP